MAQRLFSITTRGFGPTYNQKEIVMKARWETKLQAVTTKKGSDGQRISREAKNVALTDVELELVYGLCKRYAPDEFSFDFKTELEAALNHKDTLFE